MNLKRMDTLKKFKLYVEDMNNEIDELFETFTITEETKKRIEFDN